MSITVEKVKSRRNKWFWVAAPGSASLALMATIGFKW